MTNQILSLVIKTISGDREAFEKLLLSQSALIRWLIRKMTDCPEDVEDIQQEVSIRIFQHIASLKRPEAFNSWLRILVVHECKRYLTPRKLCVPIETIPEQEDHFIETDSDCIPAAHMEKLELKHLIDSALAMLPETIRKMFYMHYDKDMCHDDIGAVFGIKPGTVNVTMFRAKGHLREILSNGGIYT